MTRIVSHSGTGVCGVASSPHGFEIPRGFSWRRKDGPLVFGMFVTVAPTPYRSLHGLVAHIMPAVLTPAARRGDERAVRDLLGHTGGGEYRFQPGEPAGE